MTQSRESLLHDAATFFIRASNVLDTLRLQVWEGMGVTFPQLRILFRVRRQPGLDVRGLAASLGISPSAASQQVDKLVARGLLQRREKPEDRRYVSLELTESGQQATGEISRNNRNHIEGLLDGFSDNDLAELQRLLGMALEQERQQAASEQAMTEGRTATMATAIDPVCKMTVDPATAPAKSEHAGETYYFCAPGCKRAFDRDPAKFLVASPNEGLRPLM